MVGVRDVYLNACLLKRNDVSLIVHPSVRSNESNVTKVKESAPQADWLD